MFLISIWWIIVTKIVYSFLVYLKNSNSPKFDHLLDTDSERRPGISPLFWWGNEDIKIEYTECMKILKSVYKISTKLECKLLTNPQIPNEIQRLWPWSPQWYGPDDLMMISSALWTVGTLKVDVIALSAIALYREMYYSDSNTAIVFAVWIIHFH